MRCSLLLLFTFVVSIAFSQTKDDTIKLVQQTLKLYDLSFTTAEVDSMLDNTKTRTNLYASMHRFYPPNELPYPFAFHPAPIGTIIPDKGENKLEHSCECCAACQPERTCLLLRFATGIADKK